MGFWHRLGRLVGRGDDLGRVPDGLECEILEDVLPTEEVPVNDQQFNVRHTGNYGYHAVVGRDGLFHSEPILPGTVINTADGTHRIFTNGEWKPLPSEQGSWGSGKQLSYSEVQRLMEAMKPSPEAVEAISKALDEDIKKAMEPKFHFKGF